MLVSAEDDGAGIPAEMLPKAFNLFTQVDRPLERTQGGPGIGLSLVRRLVEMHADTVEARSGGADRGCEFVVRLPVAAGPVVPVSEVRPAPSCARCVGFSSWTTTSIPPRV